MNGKEIIDSLLRHKKAPRMGLFDSPWWDTMAAWSNEGYPTDPVSGGPVSATAHFGFDMESAGGWFDWVPKQAYSELLEETDEWTINRNGAGAAFKYWKHKSGTPEHVDFLMDSREVWERDYRDLVKADESRMNAENNTNALQAVREKGLWAFYGNQGLWECMRASLGDICMFETFLLDPGWALDFNRVYTDFFKDMYDLLFDKAGIPDGVWLYDDLAYKNGTYCSPRTLDELFAPFYKEIVDHLKKHDLPVVFHCCGGMEEALPMIADCGFDGVNPMERKAGCDPLKFARKYKDRLAFIGGLSAVTLESGDLNRIIRETDELMDGMREIGAAYVFGSDHSLSTNVSYKNYMAAIERFKQRSGYSQTF